MVEIDLLVIVGKPGHHEAIWRCCRIAQFEPATAERTWRGHCPVIEEQDALTRQEQLAQQARTALIMLSFKACRIHDVLV